MNRRTFLAAAPLTALAGCTRREGRVVLYCAEDREFAEGLLADFERETGLVVSAKYDTESTKSVSLAKELEQEAARPRCDVHWNNEILGSILLARKGVYAGYASPAAAAFPDDSRPADRAWQAFARRARVLLVNTRLVPPGQLPTSLFDLADSRWKDKTAVAKPAFGTTATHVAALFEVLGGDAAGQFLNRWKANGVRVVGGNKDVAAGVGEGRFAVGLTDTDDALAEVRAGKPVALVFPDRDGHPAFPRLGTLFIPNTVAVVRDGPNPGGARRLVDYLLRPETERRLAEGGGFQIPLNPAVDAALPPELRPLAQAKPMLVTWDAAADQWEASQRFLRNTFG